MTIFKSYFKQLHKQNLKILKIISKGESVKGHLHSEQHIRKGKKNRTMQAAEMLVRKEI